MPSRDGIPLSDAEIERLAAKVVAHLRPMLEREIRRVAQDTWTLLPAKIRNRVQAEQADAAEFGMETMTPAEVANRLKISRWTVYRMMRDGELGSVKIGKTLRVPLKDLRRLLGLIS